MHSTNDSSRAYWVRTLARVAQPVLAHAAAGTLRQRMPVEQREGAGRERFSHLEAVARTLVGMGPWLESGAADAQAWITPAQQAIDAVTHPQSPDHCNFRTGGQPLVDAALLAQAMLRAPRALWEPLPEQTKANVVRALRQTRGIRPPFSNWLLFSALVEVALRRLGAEWDAMRVDYALRQHEQWYAGDGLYGDGPELHLDYYNSFVIHPALVDIIQATADTPGWGNLRAGITARARRHAAQLERLIGPDGSFPPIGRSLAYRCGAFHALAQSALLARLPEDVSPAQARCALAAAIHRTLDAPGTFDDEGWLRIGLSGSQPGIGEGYISTGSLYLCTAAFLPLGLPPDDPFWTQPDEPWTSARAWGGADVACDRALG